LQKQLTDQQLHFVILAGLYGILFGFLAFLSPQHFYRFTGAANPFVVFSAAAALGALSFNSLLPPNAFRLFERQASLRRWVEVAALAVAFGVIAIAADVMHPFPKDLNIPWPDSPLFYPVIGFIVEIVMHVMPLAILLVVARLMTGKPASSTAVTLAIIAVAIVEPAYQAFEGLRADPSPGVAVFVAVHVFLIDLAGLWLFRRYDFVTMYAFRLAYYAIWHVVWGYLRLVILF
jgi:hypothetical protein